MANKKENAMKMDPQRFQMAKNMSVVPGGPMNNNPENVLTVGNQSPSMSGMTRNPYNDAEMDLPQMGANILNPQMVKLWSAAEHACWSRHECTGSVRYAEATVG